MLLAALRLLERDDGPVLIEDFPDDDPRARPDPAWRPPLPETEADGPPQMLAQRLEPEIASLRQAHARWRERHGYSTVGLSGLSIAEAGRYVADWLRGEAPASPREGYSAPLLLRFAVDDLKAYYLEAASGTGGKPSSRQLGDWFWNEHRGGRRPPCAARDVPGQRRRPAEADRRQFHGPRRPPESARLTGIAAARRKTLPPRRCLWLDGHKMLDPAIVRILTLGTGSANIAKRRFEFVALASVVRR